ELAETTSQVFLGIRLQCAKCHHHPYEKWSQDDYYSLAASFARVGLKGSDDFGIFGREQIVRLNLGGEGTHPQTRKAMPPRPVARGARRRLGPRSPSGGWRSGGGAATPSSLPATWATAPGVTWWAAAS